jgi:hypothetical protein
MMEVLDITQRLKALCQAVDAICQPLLKHGSATAAHVRATSRQLVSIFDRYWGRNGSEEDSLASYEVLINSNYPSNLLNFLLWTLPHLSNSFLEASQSATQGAWACAMFLLQRVVHAGSFLAKDRSSRAAGGTLLEQLQPANDISKPGKHQQRSGRGQLTTDVHLCPIARAKCRQLLPFWCAFIRKVQKTFLFNLHQSEAALLYVYDNQETWKADPSCALPVPCMQHFTEY